MNEIFFPNQYKKAVKSKAKNTTIRIGAEVGKYQVGKTYQAKSYAGRDWGVKIKVLEVIPTTAKNLKEYSIPKQTFDSIRNKASQGQKVEIIRFCYL